AFYVYAQRHRLKSGEQHERFGFFCRLHLEEFASGKVLPHEKTLASAKADRLALQRACRANLSSIFALYTAPGFSLAEAARGALATPSGAFVERLRAGFEIEEIARDRGAGALFERLQPRPGERRIGLVLRGGAGWFVLAARDGDNDPRLDGSTALRRLDVTLL